MERRNDSCARIDPLARERIMIPRSPLKHDIPLRIQFLQNGSGNQGGRISLRDDLAHIDLAQVVTHQQHVAVREKLKIMGLGDVSIAGLDALFEGVILIQNLMNDITATRVGQSFDLLGIMQVTVGEHLEIPAGIR